MPVSSSSQKEDARFLPRAVDGATEVERSVCACFKVGESQIAAALAAGATLGKLQRDLKCGTNCGSCLPELRRLAAA